MARPAVAGRLATLLGFFVGMSLLLGTCAAADRKILGASVYMGTDATKGRHPWFVSLRPYNENPRHVCGGAVINYGTKAKPGALSGKIVVTAAHCLETRDAGVDKSKYNPLVFVNPYYNNAFDENNLMVGQFPPPLTPNDYTNGGKGAATVFRTAYGAWVHPSYNYLSKGPPTYEPMSTIDFKLQTDFENDIALILLDSQVGAPFNTPAVQIPLATDKKAGSPDGWIKADTDLRLAGLGLLKRVPEFVLPTVLQQLDYRLQQLSYCDAKYYPKPAFPFANNSMVCMQAAPGKKGAHCPGDSGSAVVQLGATPFDDRAVGLVSFNSKLLECDSMPGYLTELVATNKWIRDTITMMEATFFEYTMDIFVINSKTNAFFTGQLPTPVWQAMQLYLTQMIAKKPNPGKVPIQVNYYSYKPDKTGRIRFKFTSKKKWETVRQYFTTGNYSETCTPRANMLFDYPSSLKDCRSGPFGPAVLPNSKWNRFFVTPKSFLTNTIKDLESVMEEGFGSRAGFFGDVSLRIQSILVSNGYLKPPAVCNPTSSGIDACYRSITFVAPTK